MAFNSKRERSDSSDDETSIGPESDRANRTRSMAFNSKRERSDSSDDETSIGPESDRANRTRSMAFNSKRERSDSSDDETSIGPESDPLPKSCLTEEEIQKVVSKELELVKSELKKVRKEQKFFKSHLAEFVGRCISKTLKEEVVPAICSSLEDTNRRVVREELELASSQSAQLVRSCKFQKKDEVRNLHLQFKTKLPALFFTGEKLKGENSIPIAVQLVNAVTGNIVESGPESSVKSKAVVLEGGFKTEDDCNWTREEFEEFVIKEREGKRPLLIGNLVLILNRGSGMLGDVEFTDNSKWTRSGKFRIGLQVSPRYSNNIREAVTEAFIVKENRGKSYRKHFPPAPVDEVWRLKNIKRDGPFHKKLSEAQIYNVKEFLQQLNMDSEKLRKILGEGMTGNKWEDLLDHAKTCPVNEKNYMLHDNEGDRAVISDNVGQLIGLPTDGVYRAADTFFLKQKEHGDTIVKRTFVNWNDGKELNDVTGSMQEKGSSAFPSQVSEGQIQNLTPVQYNLAPGICTAPANEGSTAEGHNGASLALPVQSQNNNFGNALEHPADHTFHLAGHQLESVEGSDILFPPGDHRNTAVELPIMPHDMSSQCAMPSQMIGSSSQMVYREDDNAPFSEPPHASIPCFQSGSTFPPFDGNRATAEIQSTVLDDEFEDFLSSILTTDDTPPPDDVI